MKVALLAPVETSSVERLLDGPCGRLPQGYPGAPLFGILAQALIEQGHEVQAFTTDSRLFGRMSEPVAAYGAGFAIHYIPSRPRSFRPEHGHLGRMLDFFAYERRGLLSSLARYRPDVIHAHWTYEFAWAALDSGVPNVITAHDSPRDVLLHSRDLYRAGRYLMAKRVLRRARHLTAVSPVIRDRLGSLAEVPIAVVPNPIPDDMFVAQPKPRQRGRKKAVLVINGWSDLKNPEPALAAFLLLRNEDPEWELHCYGADFGPDQRAAQWFLNRGATLAGIHLHGRQPHPVLLRGLASADVLVHPSRTEACNMAIAEAMSLGVPVVGGNESGGVPWQLDFGNAGYLTDIGSPPSIADSMRLAVESDTGNSDIRHRAVERARALFSASQVASQYTSHYLKAMS